MKPPKLIVPFVLTVILTFGCQVYSQVSQQWVTSYNSPTNGNDEPRAIVSDNSGNIFIAGLSPASNTGNDFVTVKYNSAGIQQWASRYHNPEGQDDNVRGIALDGSGNVFVTGSVSMGGSNGIMMTVKYNSYGEQQWAKQLGEPVASPAAPGIGKSSIATDASGNIYVGGSRRFGSGQNTSYVLIKYNSNGDSLWTRIYKGTHFLAGLGSGIVCIKVDGNFVYVTGKSFDQNPDLSTSAFVTTIKYDLSGAQQWIRKDTLINGSDDVIGMNLDVSGNIIITCNYGLDILTMKYDISGARLWRKIYAGISGDYYDRVTDLAVDSLGNVYLTGNSKRTTANGGEDFLTLKYNPSGNLLWERFYNGTYGDGDYANGITVDDNGNAYITGTAFDLNFDFNYMTIKYDTDGTEKWKISYDGGFTHRRDDATAIILDNDGNVVVTGISSRGSNFDDITTVKYSQSTGITQISSQIPRAFSLSQNYPNPFNPVTILEFEIPKSGFVSLKVYDMLGKEIVTLVDSQLNQGIYKYDFDAGTLTGGIYFYKLETNEFTETRKMLLIK
ncbi:MAG TPA: SBBP repeat-containing protein [Ignavibacteria bacterium]|nr:SBBP repeat-containing protein [Ignavibacteria bacterium]